MDIGVSGKQVFAPGTHHIHCQGCSEKRGVIRFTDTHQDFFNLHRFMGVKNVARAVENRGNAFGRQTLFDLLRLTVGSNQNSNVARLPLAGLRVGNLTDFFGNGISDQSRCCGFGYGLILICVQS